MMYLFKPYISAMNVIPFVVFNMCLLSIAAIEIVTYT